MTQAETGPEAGRSAESVDTGSGSDETVVGTAVSIAELTSVWISATGLRIKSTAELALAEAKLAVLSTVLMVLLGVVAAVFVLGAWGMLVAGITMGLTSVGVPLWISLLGLGFLHLVCAWLLLRWISNLSIHLTLPATRRHLSDPIGAREEDREEDHVT